MDFYVFVSEFLFSNKILLEWKEVIVIATTDMRQLKEFGHFCLFILVYVVFCWILFGKLRCDILKSLNCLRRLIFTNAVNNSF